MGHEVDTVYYYDAFSKQSNIGNPAGVVVNGDELTDEEMQEVAFKVGFNETAFPIKSDAVTLKSDILHQVMK